MKRLAPPNEDYAVTTNGRVWSFKSTTTKRLRPGMKQDGHLQVSLRGRDGKARSLLVHRLVIETFVGPKPEGMECRHLNGISTDNRLENLQWGTHKQNGADSVAHGTIPIGECNGKAKLSNTQVKEIKQMLSERKLTQVKIASLFGVDVDTISCIYRGYSWSWLTTTKKKPPKYKLGGL